MTDPTTTRDEAVLDHERIPTWPPLKKALWDVVTSEKLNDGHYINAYQLTDKLYAAAVDRVNRATDAEIGGIHRSLASAPAPASGRVDAVAWRTVSDFVDEMLRDWPGGDDCRMGFGLNGATVTKGQFRAVQAALASLSPAATPVSEAGGFAAAMRSVLTGGRARREDWNRPSHIERRRIDGLSNPTIVMVMKDGSVGPYTPSGCDMVASDWSIHRD